MSMSMNRGTLLRTMRCYSSRILPKVKDHGASSLLTNQNRDSGIPSPKQLKAYLDEYVIGQEIGKKVMSVVVYNHYLRINDKVKRRELQRQKELIAESKRRKEEEDQKKREEEERIRREKAEEKMSAEPEEEHTKIPEKTRKRSTLSEAEAGMRNLEKQIENQLEEEDEDLELSKSNVLVIGPSGSGKTLLAQTLARVLDVPIAISDCTQLTQAGYIGEDVEVCIERLLVNADYDVAKAERGIIVLDEIDKLAKSSTTQGTKDVSGEGVQQSLLKIIEGHNVEITVKKPVKGGKDSSNNQTMAKKEETFVINTSNILFMIMGAFVNLDKIVAKRIKEIQNKSEKEDSNEEQDAPEYSNSIEQIELENGQKVSALNLATPTDLVAYGMIPELIGRVPIISALEPLQRDDLFHILKEPKNALLDQYTYIFKQFGVRLCMTEKALKKVAQLALKERTGARGLRGIMERLLLNVNYECPESGINYVLVNEKTVDSLQQTEYSLATHVDARYYSRGQADELIADAYKEDEALGKELDHALGRTSTIAKKT